METQMMHSGSLWTTLNCIKMWFVCHMCIVCRGGERAIDFLRYSEESVTQEDKELPVESIVAFPSPVTESLTILSPCWSRGKLWFIVFGSNSAIVMQVYILYMAYWKGSPLELCCYQIYNLIDVYKIWLLNTLRCNFFS